MSATQAAPARDRLRIAIQKSGRLAEPARNLLSACGLSWRESRDKLFCYGESLPVDLLLVRDDDIPGLIADGVCDLGIVGRNELDEQAAARRQIGLPDAYQALRGLGFGQCRLMLAVPEEWQWQGPAQLAGTRIATSYPAILKQWLADQGVDAQVVELSGSVEIAPRLGTADLICDLVSSGATLRANQLTPVHNLLDSEAVLAGAVRAPDDARASLRAMLLRRLDGVVQRQDRKLLMFRASEDRVDALAQLLADAEPLVRLPADGGALRLQTMCPGPLSWQRMEELERAGAQGLMQLMPPTAARFGVSDSYDAGQNIRGGVQYLAWLLKRFNGDLTLAAAGYNAGEGAVDRHGGVPPYSETQYYVRRVGQLAERYRSALTHQ